MLTNTKSLSLLSGKDEVAKTAASILATAGTSLFHTKATTLLEPPDTYDE
jgi:hypothetical protein